MSSADPGPIVVSPRLRGEPVQKRHAAEMARVLNDPTIYRFLEDDPPGVEHLQRQYAFLSEGKSPDGKEHWLTWILRPLEDMSDPVGFIQATIKESESVTVAYVLAPPHWGKGYAREAVAAMLDTVFERYRVREAIAEMDTRNAASIALAESLGFRRQRTVRDVAEFKGSTSHEHVYTLLRTGWIERRSPQPLEL